MCSHLHDLVLQADAGDFWLWIVVALVLGLIAIYSSFRTLIRARIIEDTPTAKIRSAAQGHVELIGETRLMPGPRIVAPLSGRQCVWYSYRVEHRENRFTRSRRSKWTTVEAGTSEELFLLVDDTDECVIDPEGAEVTPSSRDIWYGNSPRPSSGPPSSWLSLVVAAYRYSEQRLDVGQHIYAIGNFKTMGTDYHGDLKQDVIAKLRAWKQDAQTMRAFDANHDGEVDIEEWEQARRVAQREVLLERAQHSTTAVTHLLGDTRDARRPFLLSAQSQHQLARRYRLYAALGFVTFVALGGLGAWLLLTRYTI